MKFLVLSLLCIAVTVAIPIELDSNDNMQLTLADIESEQQPIAINADENSQDATRSKRFILKKLALVKAGALGIGYEMNFQKI